jgi:branched-chain amino acid transport system substrate-binding protein
MSLKRKMAIGIILSMSLLFFQSNGAMAATKTLKVGVVGPYTGSNAKVGDEFKGSVEMAMSKINYQVGDYKIELVWIDSQSDPAKAASAYAEAVEKKGIQVGFLNWHSSVAAALMDLTAQYKVQHVFGMGAAPIVNEKYKSNPEKYSYWGAKGWPIPGKLMLGYVECLNNAVSKGLFKPANKKVVLFGEDTDWGHSVGAAFKKEFEKTGWTILSENYFPLTQTDFYPLLSKIKANGASVLAGTTTAQPSISALIKQSDEIGLKSIIVADGLGWTGDWYKMTGNASNYVLDMIPQLTTPQARTWAKMMEKKYGYPPSPSSSGLAYDYTNFLIKIFKRTLQKYHKLDKETIHKVVVDELYTGKLTFGTKDGALIMKNYRYDTETIPDPVIAQDAFYFPVLQYMNGKSMIVFPESWKTKDFQQKK